MAYITFRIVELDLCVVERGLVPLLAVRLPLLRVRRTSFSRNEKGQSVFIIIRKIEIFKYCYQMGQLIFRSKILTQLFRNRLYNLHIFKLTN
jgi:hypothetical protein